MRKPSTSVPLPTPAVSRISCRVKSYPIIQAGLLYRIARVLARHGTHLQLAKVSTLGERVEDTFLLSGAPLQHKRTQIEVETKLQKALEGGRPAAQVAYKVRAWRRSAPSAFRASGCSSWWRRVMMP